MDSYGKDAIAASEPDHTEVGMEGALGGGDGGGGDLGDARMAGLRGSMAVPRQQESDTLDEPVSTTIKRDALMVLKKFSYVLVPRQHGNLLKDWDLWGPLILCITLAMMLRSTARDDQKSLVFTGCFVIVVVGSVVVTLNSHLLGGKLSFFQSVCVLGYCILPHVIAAIVSRSVSAVTASFAVIHVVVVAVALAWSIWASHGFLSDSQSRQRKFLTVYPVVLFYSVIAWLVLVQPKS